jgi:2-oxoisovalerate dehydrogenase E2 component (dihydrolipoyl transacylase)
VHLGLRLADGDEAICGVIADADTRNALGLAIEIEQLRRAHATDPSLLGQATVTLVDYGPGSALFAVPPVLPGQALAVRVGAVEERVVGRDRGLGLAPTVWVCAAIDHRVLDGMDAGTLLGEMKRFLEAYG